MRARLLWLPGTLAAMALVLQCLWAVEDLPKEKNVVITQQALGGANRYLNYLSTDKPVYRAGEKVYVRSVILEAQTNFPLKNNVYTTFTIKDPKGARVLNTSSQSQDSVSALTWEIPQGQAGGVYTVTVQSLNGAPAERKFEIRAYQPPRLKTQIEFLRKGYGPGDKVGASVNIKRAEGGLPEGAKITAVARVDGVEVFRQAGLTVDGKGNCSASFELPQKIKVGDGTLSFIIKDGGVLETASKSIPILLQTMDISFYPESGDLVEGISSRVYVQALQPNGKPADIAGGVYLLDGVGKIAVTAPVAKLTTEHEGRGSFAFTPEKGKRYGLLLEKPSGIGKVFALPLAKKSGAVLTALKPVYKFSDKVILKIDSTVDSGVTEVQLRKREKLLDKKTVTVQGAAQEIELDGGEAEGVLIATLYDGNGRPLAERLVMREPKFRVMVKISPEAEEFVPGGKVKLNIESVDENGRPVEAVVGLQVTDEAVLEMIDKREQAPDLPVMVYLENEVRDLGDAEVYFNPENKDAARDIDLLLSTQGWRRFILVDFLRIKNEFENAAKRALAYSEPRLVRRFRAAGNGGGLWDRAKKKLGFAGNDEAMVLDREGKEQKEIVNEAAIDVNLVLPAAAPVKVDEKPQAVLNVVPEVVLAPQLRVVGDNVKAENVADKDAEIAAAMEAKRVAAEMEEVGDDLAKMKWASVKKSVYVREYAHTTRPGRQPNDRVDFSETLYWNAGIRTNARTGKAQVEFDLSDSVTSFKISAGAFGNNGALGSGYATLESKEPFYIEPKMPQELTVGDIVELPVALVNSTKNDFMSVNLLVSGEGLEIKQVKPLSLKAGERGRQVVYIRTIKPGEYTLVLNAAAGGYTDKVTRKLVVKPRGFPVELASGGLIDSNSAMRQVVRLPDNFEQGSIKAQLMVYPSPLANMEEALNALLRQPSGCFEQTSSTTYPLVMAQEYFTTHKGVSPNKIKQAAELLDKGYKRLIGFESKGRGYEWFGGNPAHEALTAYGLMEFTDMSRLMPVDKKMLETTREWLLSRRDGKGGFLRNQLALDSFGRAPQLITDAYIVWSLLESGEKPESLSKEIAAIKEKAKSQKDTYFLALAANILYLAADTAAADKIAMELIKAVNSTGAVGGAETSITNSGGQGLLIETTSLTILAWLKNDSKFAANVEKSMKWLFESCKGGRFGSTQSTILVLKAINAYDQARSKPKASGSLQLYIDGQTFGKPVSFDTETKEALALPDMSAALGAGEHTIELKMDKGSKMPYSFSLIYNTPKPDSAPLCALSLSTKLAKTEIVEGEPLEALVELKVKSKDAPTPVAIIGIPSGLEVRHDQLKELVKAGRVDSYEVVGRTVVLYWRALKANSEVTIPLSLTARVPGSYTAPASRTYLYYTDEYKDWQGGLTVKITPK